MRTPLRAVLAAVIAVIALFAGSVVADAAVGSSASTATVKTAHATLQHEVNHFLAQHPGTHQISAGKVAIPGGTATLATPGQTSPLGAQLACTSQHLCVLDGNGTSYNYYVCGYYSFGGIGNGTFNNNQSSGTIAKFYNSDGSLRWTNTAKDSGTASWTPVYYIRPC